MHSMIAPLQQSLNTQISIAFVLFSAVLFCLSTLSGNISSLNDASVTSVPLYENPSFYDADLQAAEYQTWSDPINDVVNLYDIESASHNGMATKNAFPFETQIRQVAKEQNIDESLIYAVTKAESSFRSEVQSKAGAVGLMQVIGSAAGRDAYYRLHKKRRTPTKTELKDPYTNLQLGSAYLKLLEEHHFGHITDQSLRKMLVLAAYNWGPVNVKRKLLRKNPPRNAEEMKWVLWVKAPRETYSYVHRVLKYQAQFSRHEA